MRLAYAQEYEAKLHAALSPSIAGPVLVFSLDHGTLRPAGEPLAFAQGGVSFRPATHDPAQLGWIPGARAAGVEQIGYVALPSGFDLTRPVAIFWGDAISVLKIAVERRSRSVERFPRSY